MTPSPETQVSILEARIQQLETKILDLVGELEEAYRESAGVSI